MDNTAFIYYIFIILFPIILLGIKGVREGEVMLIFRLGKYSRTISGPRWTMALPILESAVRINLEQGVDETEIGKLINEGVPPDIIDKIRKKS